MVNDFIIWIISAFFLNVYENLFTKFVLCIWYFFFLTVCIFIYLYFYYVKCLVHCYYYFLNYKVAFMLVA